MYIENYKFWLKKIKDMNKQKYIPHSWTGRRNMVKMTDNIIQSILHTQCNLCQNIISLFAEIENHTLQFYEMSKDA